MEPIFWESGYVDDSPLLDFLEGIITEFGNIARRRVITTANDVYTGVQMKYVIRPGEDDTQLARWRASVVKGSASVPFVFPP